MQENSIKRISGNRHSKDDAHRKGIRALDQQLSNCLMQDRMHQLTRNLSQWSQRKAPLLRGGMRYVDLRIMNNMIPIQHYVDTQCPLPPYPPPLAPQAGL